MKTILALVLTVVISSAMANDAKPIKEIDKLTAEIEYDLTMSATWMECYYEELYAAEWAPTIGYSYYDLWDASINLDFAVQYWVKANKAANKLAKMGFGYLAGKLMAGSRDPGTEAEDWP
jgi:hypothetical protein